jgi:hypothetical protein
VCGEITAVTVVVLWAVGMVCAIAGAVAAAICFLSLFRGTDLELGNPVRKLLLAGLLWLEGSAVVTLTGDLVQHLDQYDESASWSDVTLTVADAQPELVDGHVCYFVRFREVLPECRYMFAPKGHPQAGHVDFVPGAHVKARTMLLKDGERIYSFR